MRLTDIKAACIALIQTAYPSTEYRYYSSAVVEQYTRPCFFTDLFVDPAEPASQSVRHNSGTFQIEFLQDRIDEYAALRFVERVRDLFGFAVKVGDRYVKVLESEYDYDGADENVATVTFTLDWYDYVREPAGEPVMQDVYTDVKIVVEGG